MNYEVIYYFLPEIFLASSLLLLIVIFAFIANKKTVFTYKGKIKTLSLNLIEPAWATSFLISAFYFILLCLNKSEFKFDFGIYSNNFVYSLRLILCFSFLIFLIYLKEELRTFFFYTYEFFFILLFSFFSLNLILLSCNFLNVFIFIELFSLCSYYLVASQKNYEKSLESAIKYFIFGSFGSTILLFGFYLIYFATGLFDFFDISLLTQHVDLQGQKVFYMCGATLCCLGILLKIGAGFFYFWMLDVYSGINYPMLIFLNIFSKITYIFLLFNLLNAFSLNFLTLTIQILIILSLFIGAFGAFYQIKIKRFLIFTSIYNLTFFSISFWQLDAEFATTFLLFCFLYISNNLIFLIAFANIKDWNSEQPIKSLTDLPSLYKQNPKFAWFLVFLILTLTGLPPLSLFFGKFLIFVILSSKLYFFWVISLIIVSTFAFFYYIRIAKILLQKSKIFTFFFKPLPFSISLIISLHLYINIVILIYYEKILIILNNFF